MKNTGKVLQENREKQNMTISEVALATKINPRVLQAMEAGNMDKLPAISFLRGFIRSYAGHLKMDGDQLLTLFNEELNVQPQVIEELGVPNKEPERKERSSIPWYHNLPILKDTSLTSKSLVASGIILLIGLIIGVKGIVEKYEKEGHVSDAPEDIVGLKHENETNIDEGDQLRTAKSEGSAVQSETSKSDLSRSTANETKKTPLPALPPSQNPEPSKQINGTGGPKLPVETPVHKPIAEAKVTPPVSAAPAPAKLSDQPVNKTLEGVSPKAVLNTLKNPTEVGAAPVALKGGTQEIIIEALDKVEVSFRIDGGELKKIALQPEQVHTIKGKSSVSIDLVDGGAVNIIHNGIDKGVPGDLGKSKKLKYP
jgi:cytoskeletal protein RodZ